MLKKLYLNKDLIKIKIKDKDDANVSYLTFKYSNLVFI